MKAQGHMPILAPLNQTLQSIFDNAFTIALKDHVLSNPANVS
jgi:hypothetical protein